MMILSYVPFMITKFPILIIIHLLKFRTHQHSTGYSSVSIGSADAVSKSFKKVSLLKTQLKIHSRSAVRSIHFPVRKLTD